MPRDARDSKILIVRRWPADPGVDDSFYNAVLLKGQEGWMGEHDSPEEIEERLSGRLAGGSSALRSRVIAAAVLQALMATASASGKKVYDFVPPPYPERFLRSVAGLTPLALLLFALCAAVMLDLERPKSAVRAPAVCSIAVVVGGSLLAATDALNDERYQPWFFGSFFLALIPGVAIWLSAGRRSWWVALAALLSAVPTWIAVIFASLATRFFLMRFGSW